MREKLLGIISVVLIVIAVIAYFSGKSDITMMISGACIRSGAVLFALWLALPQLRQIHERVPLWIFGGAAVGLAIIAWKPKTAVVVIPILLALAGLKAIGWMLQPPRGKEGRRKEEG